MATFPSIEAFERELSKVERDLEARYRSIGEKVAKEARQEAYQAAAEDLGGDLRFSGWPPEATLQIRTKRNGAALIPTRSSAGVWTVAEYGRNTMTGPMVRMGRGGMARRTKRGNVSVVRRRRQWNGQTAGKGTASRAIARFDRHVEKIPDAELRKLLRRSFEVT